MKQRAGATVNGNLWIWLNIFLTLSFRRNFTFFIIYWQCEEILSLYCCIFNQQKWVNHIHHDSVTHMSQKYVGRKLHLIFSSIDELLTGRSVALWPLSLHDLLRACCEWVGPLYAAHTETRHPLALHRRYWNKLTTVVTPNEKYTALQPTVTLSHPLVMMFLVWPWS